MIYIFYLLVAILLINYFKLQARINENELVIQDQKDRIMKLENFTNIKFSKQDSTLKKATEIEEPESYENESITKVSHTFDKNNQWIGYEYINEISQIQTVTKYMSSKGELESIKHVFNRLYDYNETTDEFIQYMNQVKHKAIDYNNEYLSYVKSKSIDTHSSLEEAKFFRKFSI
jgi:hypothetical protein